MLRLGQGSAGNGTEATLFTMLNNSGQLRELLVCNTSSAARSVRVHIVPAGGSAGTGNAVLYDRPVNGFASLREELSTALLQGDRIQARANGTGVTITLSGNLGS